MKKVIHNRKQVKKTSSGEFSHLQLYFALGIYQSWILRNGMLDWLMSSLNGDGGAGTKLILDIKSFIQFLERVLNSYHIS